MKLNAVVSLETIQEWRLIVDFQDTCAMLFYFVAML